MFISYDQPPYYTRLLPTSSHDRLSVHVCVLTSFSYKDVGPMELGITVMASFPPATTTKALSPNMVSF